MNEVAGLNEFITTWKTDPLKVKDAFLAYRDIFSNDGRFTMKFVSRPGISHSLRVFGPARPDGSNIVALIDVVDDEPANPWLSVCFFASVVTDPDDLGDFVPQGLEGKDAICFNLDEDNPDLARYIGERLREAAKA